MTSGQEGAYFDVASNSFWDSSRGFRSVPIPAPPRRSRRGSRHGSKKTLATSGYLCPTDNASIRVHGPLHSTSAIMAWTGDALSHLLLLIFCYLALKLEAPCRQTQIPGCAQCKAV